jgi:hypothetical protein
MSLTKLDQAKIEAGFMPTATLENVRDVIADTRVKLDQLQRLRWRLEGRAPFVVRSHFRLGYCIAEAVTQNQVVPSVDAERQIGLGLHEDANESEAA